MTFSQPSISLDVEGHSVDDGEMGPGKSRLQYTITVDPNACKRMPEGLK